MYYDQWSFVWKAYKEYRTNCVYCDKIVTDVRRFSHSLHYDRSLTSEKAKCPSQSELLLTSNASLKKHRKSRIKEYLNFFLPTYRTGSYHSFIKNALLFTLKCKTEITALPLKILEGTLCHLVFIFFNTHTQIIMFYQLMDTFLSRNYLISPLSSCWFVLGNQNARETRIHHLLGLGNWDAAGSVPNTAATGDGESVEKSRRSLEGADGCFLYSLTFKKKESY